jgi:hypothetical protein
MILLAWLWGLGWLAAASLLLWPWVRRWQSLSGSSAPEGVLIRWPLTLGLSFGALTLWMLLIGFWQLNVWLVLAFPAVLLLIGFFSLPSLPRTRGELKIISVNSVLSVVNHLRRGEATAWITLVGLAAFLVVLAQATYYPFIGEDEISRYAYYARLLVVEGSVTPEVRGYPMLLPMLYAFVFFTTGQLLEQLARLVPALFSLGTVLATGALGWRWYGRRAAWAAMLALVTTPLYIRWSPDGYIDIPCALYFVLCAYAADVWFAGRNPRAAILAGALAGLAMWTKQAGFAALATLGAVFAWAIARDWKGDKQRAARDGLLALLAATLLGGLWYVRNAYYDGWVGAVPGPGQFYYQQANRSLLYLIPFVGEYSDFGLIGSLLYLAGLVWGTWRLQRGGWPLLWTVPYTLLWWQLFSYDARFLLTILPFYAILFGGLIAELPQRLLQLSASRGRWLVVAAILAAAAASLIGSRLGGWRQWLIAPTATYAERLTRAKADLYPAVEYIRDHVPVEAKIVSMDGRLRYYLMDRSINVTYPFTMVEVQQYDYFVVNTGWPGIYAGFGIADSEVAQALASPDPDQWQPVYSGPTGKLIIYRVRK